MHYFLLSETLFAKKDSEEKKMIKSSPIGSNTQ